MTTFQQLTTRATGVSCGCATGSTALRPETVFLFIYNSNEPSRKSNSVKVD